MISYGQNALEKKHEPQHTKEFMALNLRRIKHSYLMPRKERQAKGSPSITSIKIRDQFLLQIKINKRRRTYLRYSATGARNTVIMPIVVEVQSKGSMKLQLLM